MADQLNMGNLSLKDSQHAPQNGGFTERAAYIPPHLRNRPPPAAAPAPAPAPGLDGAPMGMNGAPPPMNGGGWGGNRG